MTGQFHNGEFHGYGLWISIDGSQYEGEWVNNRREGTRLPTGSFNTYIPNNQPSSEIQLISLFF